MKHRSTILAAIIIGLAVVAGGFAASSAMQHNRDLGLRKECFAATVGQDTVCR